MIYDTHGAQSATGRPTPWGLSPHGPPAEGQAGRPDDTAGAAAAAWPALQVLLLVVLGALGVGCSAEFSSTPPCKPAGRVDVLTGRGSEGAAFTCSPGGILDVLVEDERVIWRCDCPAVPQAPDAGVGP